MSNYFTMKKFSFVSMATEAECFGVVRFNGTEGISTPYEFDITLVSDTTNIDLDKILSMPVCFTIHREEGGDVDFHGILAQFDQLHKYNNFIFYRAVLVPRLWWLGESHHNQVCLNKTVPQIIELALRDAGLTKLDFDFKLRNSYDERDYVCQYNESHLNFISRWLEREGIYYYFDQTGRTEKVIFTDTYIAHTDLAASSTVYYAPVSGMMEPEKTEIVDSFICRMRQLPSKVLLKDYNYQRPSLSIDGAADVDRRGIGTDYIYGENFLTSEDGNRLAKVRAEALNCRKREFHGESTIPFMEPGYAFTLQGHYREDFCQRYLVTSITHEGNQTGYLVPEISVGNKSEKNSIYYRNTFTAIPANVQFRPQRVAQKPRISGTIHAFVDASGKGEYAELDSQGRYKVRLPFDINDDHEAGKASCYLRMMQPYANKNGGMQFPLTKGTEVLLTFMDGDPDRPVIAGAVANPENPSPVRDTNQTESVIQTGSNNKIRMEDKSGKERIIMESPTANSWVRIGAPNDPPPVYTIAPGTSITTFTDTTGEWKLYNTVNNSLITTFDTSTKGSDGNYINHNKIIAYGKPRSITITQSSPETSKYLYKIGDLQVYPSSGSTPSTTIPAGTVISYQDKLYTVTSTVQSYDSTTKRCTLICYLLKTVQLRILNDNVVTDMDSGDGIRVQTTGKLFLEGNDVYAQYATGIPSDISSLNSEMKTLTDALTSYTDISPILDLTKSATERKTAWEDLVKSGLVTIINSPAIKNSGSGDIYSFGGGAEYSFGGGYEETFLSSKDAILNVKHSEDRADKGGSEWATLDCKKLTGLTPDNTGIEKSNNVNSYEYKGNCSSLGVEYKTKEETHEYDKETYEYKYHGSQKIKESIGKDHGTDEWEWCRDTGNLLTYKTTSQYINGQNEFTFNWANKATSEISFSSLVSFEAKFGASLKTSIGLSGDTELGISAAGKIQIAINAGLNLKIMNEPAGNIEFKNHHFQTNFPGLITKCGLVDIDANQTTAKTALTELKTALTAATIVQTDINTALTSVTNSLLNIYS